MTEHKQGEMAVLALQTVQTVLRSLLNQLFAENKKSYLRILDTEEIRF